MGADPHVTPAVLQKMIDNIFGQPVLNSEMFKIKSCIDGL